MKFIQNDPVVTKITVAVFVPAGSGAPVHSCRSAHGLAFNVDHSTTYRFSDGKVLRCGSGECIFLPQGCSYTVDRTLRSESSAAGVYAINFWLLEPVSDGPQVLKLRQPEGALSAFRRAQKAWRQKEIGFREACFRELYTVFGCLHREQRVASRQDRVAQRLLPALSYIDANYTAQPVELARLARLCGISQPYLRRLFHMSFGVSPAVYVRNRRLKYAMELLATGEYSVTDAAGMAGFNDTAYFSREFKRFTGLAPREYAKKA